MFCTYSTNETSMQAAHAAFYAPRCSTSLDRVRRGTTHGLVKDALKDRECGKLNTRAEFLNAEAQRVSRHACEHHASVLKFFFDYDELFVTSINETGTRPSEDDLERKRVHIEDRVRSIITEGAGVGPSTYKVHMAQRHGYIQGGRFKISFRAFVSGIKTDMYSIKNAIKRVPVLPNTGLAFDTSVYSKNRRLCMILGCKSQEDTRILMPLDDDLSEANLLNYVAQHTEEHWPMVTVDAHGQQDLLRFMQRDTDDVGDWPEGDPLGRVPIEPEDLADGDGPRKRQRRRGGAGDGAPRTEAFQLLRDILRGSGFANAQQSGPAVVEDDNGVFIPFDCDRRDDCPICHGEHESNMWSLHVSPSGGVGVCNQSEHCSKVGLFSPHFLHPFVTKILNQTDSHMDFAECYLESREGTLLFNEGTGSFHEFRDQMWKIVPEELVVENVRVFMAKQLLDPIMVRLTDWLEAAKALRLDAECLSKIKSLSKKVTSSRNKAGTHTFLTSLAKIMRGMVYAEANKFDRNHDLLHFTNGVLDLQTMAFRDAQPGDFNTITTGYDYQSETDDALRDMHADFIAKIYPDPGHREVAQRVLGSTLTGYNTGKKLYVFTDNGGEFGGNNGKTAVFDLHIHTMGDYGVVAKKDFLYDSNNSNAEGATPFMAKLASKRAVLVEELEPNKKLAEGTIKEMTNGTNALLPVRELHKGAKMMEMCAKIMVGCNHGKFPRFDPYDEALTGRFLPVPHISHFTSDVSKLDAVHHVYLKDMDIGIKVSRVWKPASKDDPSWLCRNRISRSYARSSCYLSGICPLHGFQSRASH